MGRHKNGNGFSHKQHYINNKVTIAKDRKDKYDNDPEHRELLKKKAREYKASIKPPAGMSRKEYNGKEILAYKARTVANRLGITTKLLLIWEQKNWIPSQIFDTPHRCYTKHQVGLLQKVKAKLLGKDKGAKTTAMNTLEGQWYNAI
jgi:hypothetical protein